jgi:hypothetical protein
MSWLSDTTELVSSAWLSSAYTGHGILGYNIPSSGVSGGSPLLNDSIVSGEEYRWTLNTAPSAGTLVLCEDTSFDFYGAPDGTYSFVYRLYESGVDSGLATVYLGVGPAVAFISSTLANATMSGSASVSTGATFSLASSSDFAGSAYSGVVAGFFAVSSLSDFVGDASVSPSVAFDLAALSAFSGSASLDLTSTASFGVGSFSLFLGSAEGDLTPVYGDIVRLYSRLATSVFMGDVGTEIIVDCGADITTATVRSIVVRKPSGVKVIWPAEMLTSTMIKYTVLEGDLDIPGKWKLQAYVEMPSGKWFGEVAALNVSRPI